MRLLCPIGSLTITSQTLKSFIIPVLLFYMIISVSGQDKEKTTSDSSKQIQQSKTFYDSIHQKFSRHSVTKLMYDLAFTNPKEPLVTDSAQRIKSESPFNRYHGKIIRKIKILTLDPFGTIISDTIERPQSKAGKALNSVHILTRKFIIRRNLFFKPGDAVDPSVFAENERILRDMPSIDNARIILTRAGIGKDSVDVTVITKDVWSIGIDLLSVALNKVSVRVFDGNFLGLGDRLANTISFKLDRVPFFRYDGVSYNYTNIAGTFIDGIFSFYQDDIGNMNVNGGFIRNFYSNQTKWAGGAVIDFYRDINLIKESVSITSRYNLEKLWFGWAFLPKEKKMSARFVIMQAVYRKDYSERPSVTIDSSNRYFNKFQFLTKLSFSKNHYYLTDYVLKFGKTEDIPYGHLFQITLGPEYSEFYTRLYTGFEVSGGDFIHNFGYLAGTLKVGGFYYHSSFEDAVIKSDVRYISYLYSTRGKKFRFRYFVSAGYKRGVNFRNNNFDYSDINQDFKIQTVKIDSLFYGIHSLNLRFSVIMYTPLYFYGFKFALLGQLQGGIFSAKMENLFQRPFYTGMGLGLLIKNNNLIFPTILLNIFYYPYVPQGVPPVQFVIQNAEFHVPDFNVDPPNTETLGN
jgi:hypothetical protein